MLSTTPDGIESFLVDSIGVSNPRHMELLAMVLPRLAEKECLHHYLEKWDCEHVCNDCKTKVVDASRVAQEVEIESRIAPSAIPPYEESEGSLFQKRGVPVSWLVDFTIKHDCWHMTTWDVRRMFVLPATAARRCRYVELNFMSDVVGPASTFISHCWGGTWGCCKRSEPKESLDERVYLGLSYMGIHIQWWVI